MISKISIFIILIIFAGCSKVDTINLKEHPLNKKPNIIIWLQIPGLDSEHLSLIKFNKQGENLLTSIEDSTCMGEAWGFNFYDLRPFSKASYLSQLSGSKDIKLNCQDYTRPNLFTLINELGGESFVLEAGIRDEDSFEEAWRCPQGENNMAQNISLFRMSKANKGNRLFHFQEPLNIEKGAIYYDRSCQQGECYSSVLNNIRALWKSRDQRRNIFSFIIRDFRFLNSLKRGKISFSKEILYEVEKIHQFFKAENKEERALILLTSAEVQKVDFPRAGRRWHEMENKGKNVFYRQQRLLAPVFATGNGAENFCGIYEESDIFRRIFWSSKDKKINLEIFKKFFNE